MLLSSVQTAKESPGLPLGLAQISTWWIRKIVQGLTIICFPITILLLRLYHQFTLKKWETIKKLQDKRHEQEFNRLTSLLELFEIQKTKRVKITVAFEATHEIFIGIALVMLSVSATKTTTAMDVLFQLEGKTFAGINNYDLFIGKYELGTVS